MNEDDNGKFRLERGNETGLKLFLDFKKAFDSIEWQFIWRALNKYKFGPKFSLCVKTLYVDSKIICKIIIGYMRKFRCLEEYDRADLYPPCCL